MIALPAGSKIVPIARPLPSGFGTFVETRTYSSPVFGNSVAVPPFFFHDRINDIVLLILVAPKYKAAAFFPETVSIPSTLGAPSFAVAAFNAVIDFCTFGSACAFPTLGKG
jgi:hypothetical protein